MPTDEGSSVDRAQDEQLKKIMAFISQGGDLGKLSEEQRTEYYLATCNSLGLNHFTKPFSYIMLNGKLQLYVLRDGTDQLRTLKQVSIEITAREMIDELYLVQARATIPGGRMDESTGVVNLEGLTGEKRANGIMKAETKAKRRVTLSICGLGWLDETEVADIPGAKAPEQNKANGAAPEEASVPSQVAKLKENLNRRADAEEATAVISNGEGKVMKVTTEKKPRKIGKKDQDELWKQCREACENEDEAKDLLLQGLEQIGKKASKDLVKAELVLFQDIVTKYATSKADAQEVQA